MVSSDEWARRRARSDDPETSKEAARAVTKSGLAEKQHSIVRKGVADHPGWTSRELAETIDLVDAIRVFNRRLPELESKGVVERGTPRPCRVTGRRALTWYPKRRQTELFSGKGGAE